MQHKSEILTLGSKECVPNGDQWDMASLRGVSCSFLAYNIYPVLVPTFGILLSCWIMEWLHCGRSFAYVALISVSWTCLAVFFHMLGYLTGPEKFMCEAY